MAGVYAGSATGAAPGNGNSTAQDCAFRIMSYNIDGLDNLHDIAMRANAVCDIIEAEKPDVVLLQEVVAENLLVLSNRLARSYEILAPSSESRYYTAVLTRFESCDTSSAVHTVDNFPGSTMGRDLLQLSNVVSRKTQHRIAVCTAHLESSGGISAERKRQLACVYQAMMSLHINHDMVLYGGDTNLKKAEVQACPAPDGVENVWEKCGSPQDARYTFDMKSNDNNLQKGWSGPFIQTQIDKMFWTAGRLDNARKALLPRTFRLAGMERMKQGFFPSDHFAVVCDLVES